MYSQRLLILGWFAGLVVLPSCNSPRPDPSIVVDESLRVDPEVENGTAYDRSVLELGKAKKVVLPDNATVRRAGEAGKVQLFMAKTLAFVGHPPEAMNLQGARKNMGCAIRADGDAFVVATYGEWDSRKEGGASMKLVVVVPDGVEVEQRKGLSGPDSTGREWQGQYLTKPKDAQGGYWYGPASPAEGWTALPAVPDPERTAAK
jgi:hypothetical protein